MRLVIIGDGLVGRSLADAAPDAVLLSHADVDLLSSRSVDRMLRRERPGAVIDTAALHSLPACEADPQRAFALNARAVEHLARRAWTIYISTDYVFTDGGPHAEVLPGQQPRSVYGRSKLAGELATLEHGGVVVRLAAVYGHHPSHKGPQFPDRILSAVTPLRLPADQRFSPTYAPDAARAILDLLTEDPQGIYHATGRGATTWPEFAEQVCALTAHRRVITSFEAHDPLRPRDSSLRDTRGLGVPHWVAGLTTWARVTRRLAA